MILEGCASERVRLADDPENAASALVAFPFAPESPTLEGRVDGGSR
jgi:hypothetical protein